MCPARCAPAHGASPSLDSGLPHRSFLWLFSSGKLMDFPNLILKGGKICIVISEGGETFSKLGFEQNQGLESPISPHPLRAERDAVTIYPVVCPACDVYRPRHPIEWPLLPLFKGRPDPGRAVKGERPLAADPTAVGKEVALMPPGR